MKKYTYISILLIIGILSSCSNDFFELNPSNSVATSKVYKTAEDFDVAVIGCYSKLQSQVNFYTECCEYRSDNLFIEAPTAGTQDRYDIDHFTTKPSNGILNSYWANFNNNVYRCNLVLEKIDNANIDETLKKQYKGEAMFIRALNYFNMYRAWGGVPTTRVPVGVDEAMKIKRSSDDEMYEFIAGDLENIIKNNMLPDTYNSNQIGRATSGAAMALLGKVYLTFHKWDKARDVLTKVIGKYELLPNIDDVFNVNNKNNKEIIFAVKFNKDLENEGHGYWYNITNQNDETNQTEALLNCFSKNDVRKDLITYYKATSKVYLMKKFMDQKSDVFNKTGNDQILLRYADVLLMLSEALNEIGYNASSNSDALIYLNKVRNRVGLTSLTSAELTSYEVFKKAIALERQREFPYEGQRWFDLVRMGYAKEAIEKAQGITIQDYQFLFPIPESAIERIRNSNILWQNPGY